MVLNRDIVRNIALAKTIMCFYAYRVLDVGRRKDTEEEVMNKRRDVRIRMWL